MNPPSFVTASLYVAAGGGAGAWLRFAFSRLVTAAIGPVAADAFPWATLAINLLGSFAMGLLASWLARHGAAGETWRLLIGVGVLGGFTTFSAFSLEIVMLAQRGAVGLAGLYAGLSLLGGVAGLYAGLAFMRGSAA